MPSASTATCEQCELHPSKYTCPACKARTCSLACTKAHKDATTAKRVCSSTSVSGATSSSATAASSSASESSSFAPPVVAQAAGASVTSAPSSYVPLSEYGESHMLQDYLFLSSISRTTSETGRKIMSLNLLPPPSSNSSDLTSSKHNATAAGNAKQTHQQRQREQLIKQLHYRRFRVMVLPEGMARRKANASQFNPKDRKMVLSVEVKLPSHPKKGLGWMAHKQDPGRLVEDVILGEMQHRSFVNKKDRAKAKEMFTLSCDKGEKLWIVSLEIIAESGLPKPKPSMDTEQKDVWIALRGMPKEWAVIVPAYSARLTNETTTRYLDWWTRKRDWEAANPEMAEMQREAEARGEGRYAPRGRYVEGRRGDGQWNGRGNGKVEEGDPPEAGVFPPPPTAATAAETPAAAAAAAERTSIAETPIAPPLEGIVSNALLSKLSAKLGRTNQPSQSPTIPLPQHSQSTSPPSPSQASSAANATQNAPAQTPSADYSKQHNQTHPISGESATTTATATSIKIHIVHPRATTLAWMLQSLPEGYSVVEFPEVRIIAAVDTAKDEGLVEMLPEEVEGQNDKQVGSVEDKKKAEKEKSTVSVVTTTTCGSLGGLLAGYDSDSDSEAEYDAGIETSPAQHNSATLQKPNAAQQEENRDEMDKEEKSIGGSLAHLASMHGFIPTTEDASTKP